jgi:hypothetical protein
LALRVTQFAGRLQGLDQPRRVFLQEPGVDVTAMHIVLATEDPAEVGRVGDEAPGRRDERDEPVDGRHRAVRDAGERPRRVGS